MKKKLEVGCGVSFLALLFVCVFMPQTRNAVASWLGDLNKAGMDANPGVSFHPLADNVTDLGKSTSRFENLYLSGSISGMTSNVFEGSTADDYETTLGVVDPTADRTVTLPNATGYTLLTSSAAAGDDAGAVTGGASLLLFEGAIANGFETTVTVTDPTADRTVTFPDASGVPILTATVPEGANSITGLAGNGFTFEGTADTFETHLLVSDTTGSDKTITLPNATGVPILSTALPGAADSISGAASGFEFEGATDNGFELSFGAMDPTADRTIILPDADGYMMLSAGAPTGADGVAGVASGFEFEGATDDGFETTVSVTDPTADRAIVFPDRAGTVWVTEHSMDATIAGSIYPLFAGGGGLVFEGDTADGFETIIGVEDPTADNTIVTPANVGTNARFLVALAASNAVDGFKGIANGFEFEGGVADEFETSVTASTPSADRTITFPDQSGSVVVTGRTAQVFVHKAGAKVGATAGWVVAVGDNTHMLTLPQNQAAATLVIPVSGLKVGDTITGFYLTGQIENTAAAAATVDCALFKLTASAADFTDASIGAMTQISVAVDTKIGTANSTKTLDTPEVISEDETFYFLVTATTGAAVDMVLSGAATIVTEN